MSFDYCTALHLAAYYGHWPVIQQLAESGKCNPGQLFSARNAQVKCQNTSEDYCITVLGKHGHFIYQYFTVAWSLSVKAHCMWLQGLQKSN